MGAVALNFYFTQLSILYLVSRYPELRLRMVRHFSFLVLLFVTVLTLDLYKGETITSIMTRDPQTDGQKCETFQPNTKIPNRTFKLKGSNAKESICKKKCAEDKDCVAMSGKLSGGHIWCIGCKVPLNSPHEGAIAYRKTERACSFEALSSNECPSNLGPLIDIECTSDMAHGELCEADDTLPDGQTNYDIDNCGGIGSGGYDVFRCNRGQPSG